MTPFRAFASRRPTSRVSRHVIRLPANWCRSDRVRSEWPGTWVTERTGHMGYTFRLLAAGGVDAVEREYGHGRTSAFRRPTAGGGADDGALPGVRHLAEDRAQALRPLQGARAGGAGRPAAATGAGGEPAADADRGDDRGAAARASELGGAQAPRARLAAARAGGAGAGALDDPRGPRPPRAGRACACPPPAGGGHAALRAGGAERALVLRLQGRVPSRQRLGSATRSPSPTRPRVTS